MYNLNERRCKKVLTQYCYTVLKTIAHHSNNQHHQRTNTNQTPKWEKFQLAPINPNLPIPPHLKTLPTAISLKKKTQRQKMASTITDISQCFFFTLAAKRHKFHNRLHKYCLFCDGVFRRKTIACPFHYSKIVRPLFRAFSAVFFSVEISPALLSSPFPTRPNDRCHWFMWFLLWIWMCLGWCEIYFRRLWG